MNNKMSLTFNFETHEDLQLFLIDINNLINKRSKPKKIKRPKRVGNSRTTQEG